MNTQLNQSTDFNSSQTEEQPTTSSRGSAVLEKSKEAARNMKQMARETKETVMHQGTETAHQLKEQGKTYADEQKSQLGERIHGYSSAVRRAAEKLREERDPNIAHYAESVAERLDKAADYVQTRDVGMILRDVEDAARRRPEIFFGGMFVAGLALSRFFKASGDRHEMEADSDNYWVEDEEESALEEQSLSSPPSMQAIPPSGDPIAASDPTMGTPEQETDWSQAPTTNPKGNI